MNSKRVKQGLVIILLMLNSVSMTLNAKEYSEQVKNDFMQGCALTDEMREFCECTIKNMSNFATEEEFKSIVDLAHEKGETEKLEALSIKAIEGCKILLD